MAKKPTAKGKTKAKKPGQRLVRAQRAAQEVGAPLENARMEAFAVGIAGGLNATAAARAADFKGSESTLAVNGHRLVRNHKVKNRIKELCAAVLFAEIARIPEAQLLMTEVMYNDPSLHTEYALTVTGHPIVDPSKLTPELAMHLREFGLPPAGVDPYLRKVVPVEVRLRAATELIRSQGGSVDNVNVKIEGGMSQMLALVQAEATPAEFARFVELISSAAAKLAAQRGAA